MKKKETFGNVHLNYKNDTLENFYLFYNKECNHDRINELEKNLSAIESVDKKIEYCKKILKEYYLFIDPVTLAVSAMTIAKGIFPPDKKMFFDRTIQFYIDELEAEKLTKKRKKPVITSPAFALFAQIVNFSGLLVIGENETDETYCERVINHFKIFDVSLQKCRQAFKKYEPDLKQSDRNFIIVINSILPKLNNRDKDKIQKYIDSKIKLYG